MTPMVYKLGLWETSGHLQNYKEDILYMRFLRIFTYKRYHIYSNHNDHEIIKPKINELEFFIIKAKTFFSITIT